MTALAWLLLQSGAMLAGPVDLPQAVSAAVAQEQEQDPEVMRLREARELATSGDPAQRQRALAMYDAMLQASPGNTDVLLARGRTYAWAGRYQEAEADLRAVTAAKPGYADAWSALGDLYLWSGQPRLAADAYAHWVALEPQSPAPYLARGRAWRAAGEREAARADFLAAGERGTAAEEVADLLASVQIATPDALRNDGYRWQLRASWDHTGFDGGRTAWNDTTVSVRRRFTQGSLALEWLQADHFSQRDAAWALDGYAGLWSRAYANLRYQQGPANGVLPRQSWRAELFQGVGAGWELSASVDHLRFSGTTAFYGVGVGRYWGDWYARYKLQHVPGVASGSWSQRLLLRNYYRGNGDDYLELTVSHGRSADLDRGGALVRNASAAFGAAWVRYFGTWGFKLGAGGANDADGFHEREFSVALYRRW
ncbi:YaiO family outer membrane beta-barrel protein [Thermomonas hydrothermalis]|uniref:Outer membrane protein, YaiO family n=1 Tax=Thermomonas hydrothermalis TaxID=213588 RepID=A0A1M4YM77_9GAMM|nr:YaiO family outer membrane beta-barrel protein [Thermomonas hydrothermalis]SHF06904.1 outer membrane protein, YaiO family [Thermomonas hydrothermalis]